MDILFLRPIENWEGYYEVTRKKLLEDRVKLDDDMVLFTRTLEYNQDFEDIKEIVNILDRNLLYAPYDDEELTRKIWLYFRKRKMKVPEGNRALALLEIANTKYNNMKEKNTRELYLTRENVTGNSMESIAVLDKIDRSVLNLLELKDSSIRVYDQEQEPGMRRDDFFVRIRKSYIKQDIDVGNRVFHVTKLSVPTYEIIKIDQPEWKKHENYWELDMMSVLKKHKKEIIAICREQVLLRKEYRAELFVNDLPREIGIYVVDFLTGPTASLSMEDDADESWLEDERDVKKLKTEICLKCLKRL